MLATSKTRTIHARPSWILLFGIGGAFISAGIKPFSTFRAAPTHEGSFMVNEEESVLSVPE
jgi:hypothetical protein